MLLELLTSASTRIRIPGTAVVVLTPEAAEELEGLGNPIHGRVLRLLARLEQWPEVSGAKPLVGALAGRMAERKNNFDKL